ncbi:hypothetical protein K2173_026659 [Erythroxylum novogranatense]|uniref:tripeptidyl-peptidase II n=1 Tax=Erythroxylum novogranatense TaxID=1862640 RepID=A0AAV8TX31_9ROSI|nr:hypothetical protein K2173_026659 [Erythroxylum novogranatense]
MLNSNQVVRTQSLSQRTSLLSFLFLLKHVTNEIIRDLAKKRQRLRSSNNKRGSSGRISAMPCGSKTVAGGGDGDNDGSLRNFKLNESTFLASLMPKKEIGVDRFLEAHPEFDGRGTVIAIFDTGVDPAAAGLQETSDGKPKVLDVIDCSGSGYVDTSKVVKADDDGRIMGTSGAALLVNSSWKNPSGEWHVGCKLVYELFPNSLTSRLKRERRKKWDEKNHEEIANAVKQLDEFNQKHPNPDDVNLKKIREDLQHRIDILRKQADSYDDRGPVIDAVVWHDGELWRAALDTQSLEEEPDCGKLANFEPLTNYRIERKYGVFSKLDACTVVLNVYDEGDILSIVTDCCSHGTHVAGIATAFHPKEPLLNGVAPGAQLISCKIGDLRLRSADTGAALTRALTAAVVHKCDLINMSYGGTTLLPNYGRFVDLVNEVVNKHRIIFVSSVGNRGPALSTVGAPGGTTSSIIGIGAYVSPAMAAGAHCVVEPPSEGLEYTSSSRGPTTDGDLGVCVSAPGGAVAPVPTWTLQKRMLKNGTSMSSPSACGGIALLLSAMKAKRIPVSPYSVRKALENTSIPVHESLADELSAGHGLMQVDKAYEYILQSRCLPCVNYEIKINLSGKSTPTSRGIYLREASACQQPTEWTVQVEPKFHEGASNLEELVPFEECIEIYSSEKSVVRAPEYLLLTHNGRSFNIVIDPTKLSDGLHYHKVYGIDCKARWRGPLFSIPITITKPMTVKNRPPLVLFPNMSFLPGHIERRFIEVPFGATWVKATLRTSGFDTARRVSVDAVQICPQQRPITWKSVVTPASKSFKFPVVGCQTLELAVAQVWSSGIGSHQTTIVDFEIVFHGIDVDQKDIILDGSEAPVRISVKALLSFEKLAPACTLNKIRVPYRPTDAKLTTLTGKRDKLPSGKQTLALTLTYKFKLEDGAEVKPQIPFLNNLGHDNIFESLFFMISDTNKRVYAMGDVYPISTKLPKGEYTLQLYLRHYNVQLLEKMKQLVLFIERKLENKDVLRLNFFSEPDGLVMGNGAFKSSILIPGKEEALYVGPPAKDMLPKNAPQGSVLVGSISYSKLSFAGQEGRKDPQKKPVSYQVSFVVPPSKVDEDKGKSTSPSSKTVSERLEKEVRDAKIKVFASLKQNTEEEHLEWKKLSSSLKSEYPKYTPLLEKILEGVLSRSNVEDKIRQAEEVIDVANDVIDSIDRDELAKFLSQKSDPEDEEAKNIKKKMETARDQLAEALYQKGLSLAEIESLKGEKAQSLTGTESVEDVGKNGDPSATGSDGQSDLFEENFKELQKWVNMKSLKYGTLSVIRERRRGRLGTALKVLHGMIKEEGHPPKKKLYELQLSLLEEIGWNHISTYEKQWMHEIEVLRYPLQGENDTQWVVRRGKSR